MKKKDLRNNRIKYLACQLINFDLGIDKDLDLFDLEGLTDKQRERYESKYKFWDLRALDHE
tara:strand:- start:4526 stop:4708 length:183 start_codon:yes stop_codon:yes gene_type:complete